MVVTAEKAGQVTALHEPGPGGSGGRSSRALSLARLMPLKGLSALDLGSNQGYNSFDLFECGCSPVVGVEIRSAYLEAAEKEKARLGYAPVTFLSRDVRKIDEMGLGHFDVCLCAGLLYHMQNPFNLLKRIRNICNVLALETHVAPGLFNFFRAGPKYRQNLTLAGHRVILDGVPFRGRLNIFPVEQKMEDTSGSFDSRCTFWPYKESLISALELAGFDIVAFYGASVPAGQPPILVRHGRERTKVFVLAKTREPDRMIPVGESRVSGCRRLEESR